MYCRVALRLPGVFTSTPPPQNPQSPRPNPPDTTLPVHPDETLKTASRRPYQRTHVLLG